MKMLRARTKLVVIEIQCARLCVSSRMAVESVGRAVLPRQGNKEVSNKISKTKKKDKKNGKEERNFINANEENNNKQQRFRCRRLELLLHTRLTED